nr:immunoglobulin heavy chain junction region [Macaca mulatta]MOY25000.1 immunoglobulin heavy chain junction region [Macaca mulatta]MOY26749.1 immunoglobulin heavy chain junction region [Macaca mulatta]
CVTSTLASEGFDYW